MIPKIIHYCWFGGNPLPKDAQKCIASWKKYFPDYEIKQWNESNFDVNCCPYVKEAYEAKKYAFVSDYARFWMLYHEGGVYFDTDVEVIRDMSSVIADGSFMGFEKGLEGSEMGVNPGLGLGIEARNSIIRDILSLYQAKSSFDIGEGTIVHFTTEVLSRYGLIRENYKQKVGGIVIYPADYFCPMDSTTGITTITDNTVSIHHYSCSWIDHNTFSWRMHEFKNWLISIFGAGFIMKISSIFRK